MEPQVIIKSVKIAEDLEEITEMMKELHVHEHSLFDKTDHWPNIQDGYMRHIIMMQEEYEGTFLIAYIDDAPAGFIFGYIEEQDDSRIEIYMGKELYISDGFVVPEYRGHGVYKKLNTEIENIYIEKGVKRICRHTLINNARARGFLEREGYFVTRLLYEKWM